MSQLFFLGLTIREREGKESFLQSINRRNVQCSEFLGMQSSHEEDKAAEKAFHLNPTFSPSTYLLTLISVMCNKVMMFIIQ